MRKLLAMVLSMAMLLSLCTVVSFAADDRYFEAVGERSIEWDEDASNKITFDGNLDDWQRAGYTLNDPITMDNMVFFDHVPGRSMPGNFALRTYFVSDSEWLYVGFYVDDDCVKMPVSEEIHQYGTGDAFQIAIDFNAQNEALLEEYGMDYFTSIGADTENIFYSFAFLGDGKDVLIARQNAKDALGVELLAQSQGDPVKGKMSKTDEGWCAEFALSWDMLYEDFFYKSYLDDYTAVVSEDTPLQLGISLCYLNADDIGAQQGCVGTFKSLDCKTNEYTVEGGYAPEECGNGVDPTDNGMYLTLEYVPGMYFDCAGIEVLDDGDEPGTDDPGIDTPDVAPGTFDDMSKLEGFNAQKQGSFLRGDMSNVEVRNDGSILVTLNEDAAEATSVTASFVFEYARIVAGGYTGFDPALKVFKDKVPFIPNNGDAAYSTIVLKIKSNGLAADEIYVTTVTGNGESGMQYPVVGEKDGFTYLVYNMAEVTENFTDSYINNMSFYWLDANMSEELLDANMEVYCLQLFNSPEEAATELGLTLGLPEDPGTDEPTTDEPTTGEPTTDEPTTNEPATNEPTTDEPTVNEPDTNEPATNEPATNAPATNAPAGDDKGDDKTEEKSGCGGVIGMSAAALVMAAAAAAVVLKKKED